MEEMYMECFMRSIGELDSEDYVRNHAFVELVMLGFSTADIGTYYLADVVDFIHYDMNEENRAMIYQTLQNDNNVFTVEMASYYEIAPAKVQKSLKEAYEHVSDGSVLKHFSSCASECAYLIASHLQEQEMKISPEDLQMKKEVVSY